ncbi:Two-component response regulator-like [Quillaja saponaria]|uniref:Two-component response regulator-like n=1 Tax=Quillaja saponaria TaxID=32244 RepID=A0AAD7LEC6_QUISA|nr:Two-component response regulator-like [Quillaja saponaria]
MEGKGFDLNNDCMGVGNNSRSNDGFIDRSKVRILLCDNDSKSTDEVFTLLLRCSYQVTSVRSARQVIDALNAEGPDIDIILAEVDLPMAKGTKMLKYITRDKELRRIPVIMMSAQDEVSVVVKCLRLGAADYLVKPLRTNELLNLWTHMWRRRHMLGLVEKNILNYDFDLAVSDPSDANTTSTTLFSDDTDDKLRRSNNPEMGVSVQQEDECAAAAVPPCAQVVEYPPDVPGISDRRTGQFSPGPMKSELRIGESSAFFTYVKSALTKSNSQGIAHIDYNVAANLRSEDMNQVSVQQVVNDFQILENGEAWESHSQDDLPSSNKSIPDSLSMERSSTPPASMEFSEKSQFKEDKLLHSVVPRNGTRGPELEVSGLPPQYAYPYYMPGVVNQVVMPPSAQMYQKNLQDLQTHASKAMVSQYNHFPQCPPHASGMTSFPYYPVSICLQPGQMSATQSWSSFGNPSPSEVKLSKVDRREAALIKFRQKRKERCFDKKIRYINRKQLAERRQRVRGQFVRKVNGVNVDLNGQPPSGDYNVDGEEDDEDHAGRDSSPEDDASRF